MPEIKSYSACVQLINHPDSFGDVREKGESAASVSVDPRIPIAGVGDRSGSLDCILGFVGIHDLHACVPTRKWACCTYVQLSQIGIAREMPVLSLGYQCRCIQLMVFFPLISPIITYIPSWDLFLRPDLHKVSLGGSYFQLTAFIDIEGLIHAVSPVIFPVSSVLVTRIWLEHSSITVMFSVLS